MGSPSVSEASDERADVRAMLGVADVERLRFAVLKLSEGSWFRLRAAVNEAKIDFRDVLTAAGFVDLETYKSWLPELKW